MSRKDDLLREIMQRNPAQDLARTAAAFVKVLTNSKPVPNSTLEERQDFLENVAAECEKEHKAAGTAEVERVPVAPVYDYEYSGVPSTEHLRASQEALRFACRDMGIQRHPKVRWCRLFGNIPARGWIPAKNGGTKTGFTFDCQFDGMARFSDWEILINAEVSPARVTEVVLHELRHLHQHLNNLAISEIDAGKYEADGMKRMAAWERGDLTAFNKAPR